MNRSITAISLVVFAAPAWAGVPTFTGNVEVDFTPATFPDLIVVQDLLIGDDVGPPAPDIDYYDQAPEPPANWAAGVDVKDVRLLYDPISDTLHVGINFFGIGGDMDGNGDPSAMDPALAAFGDDFANWQGGESWIAKFDLAGDAKYELIAGVSGVEGIDQFAVRLPFGPDEGFGGDTVVFHNGAIVYHGTPNAGDVEFTVVNFCQALEKPAWSIRVRVASLQDGLEEESVPNSMPYTLTPEDIAAIPAFQDDDADGLPNCNDDCQDVDGDGAGAGPGCPDDCDDTSAACAADCSDADNDLIADCKDPCVDVDGDGFGDAGACAAICADDPNPAQCQLTCEGMCQPDCDDDVFACNVDCVTDADNDELADCEDPCVDPDGDGFGDASACAAICQDDDDPEACTADCQAQCPADCDPTSAACNDDCATDVDDDDISDCKDPCVDVDDDDYGNSSACAAICQAEVDPALCKQNCEAACLPDCNDSVATCTDDCTTDLDDNDVPDCEQLCVDGDGDGYGIGDQCKGPDCDDDAPTCTVDCATDEDEDDIPDCKDPCVDPDGDNHGDNSACKAMCASNIDPQNCEADCDISCPADCDETSAECTDSCSADADDDDIPDCKDSCIDPDGDGYGVGDGCAGGPCDCDEGNAACNVPNDPMVQECVSSVECLDANTDGVADCREPPCDDPSDTDGDGIPNCKDDDDDDDGILDVDEPSFGTDPNDPDSDDDGLKDGEEVNVYDTDPNDPDTDDGGELDGNEVSYGTDPRAGHGDDDFTFEYAGGGGCQSSERSGAPAWAWLLGLLLLVALRRRGAVLGLLLVAGMLLTPESARAQRDGFGIDHFVIKPGADRIFMVEGSEIAPAWQPYGGIWLHYARNPLALRRTNQGGTSEDDVVGNRFYGEAAVGIGLFDYVELDFTLPVVFLSDGDTGVLPSRFSGISLDDAGVGDLIIRLRGRIVGRDSDAQGFGFTIGLGVGIPTGDPERFQGDGKVWLQPNLAFAYGVGPATLALNLGFNLRTDDESFENLNLGSEMTWGLGALFRINEVVRLGAEVFGRWNLVEPFAGSSDSPLEIVAGPRLKVFKDLWVEAGAGAGIVSGYGTPDFRLFLGLQWAPMVLPPGDRDGDGYTDDVDECPDDPEDFDGYQDRDGCPDTDNDADGIPDLKDGPLDSSGFGKCRDIAEDRDGFNDLDGCPDVDNDQDGVPDELDGKKDASGFGRCRDKPEDKDGFEDTDGCPDEDNDLDGIPDLTDGEKDSSGFGRCRNLPENKNGVDDDDGCPDTDLPLFSQPLPVEFETAQPPENPEFPLKEYIEPKYHKMLTQLAETLKSGQVKDPLSGDTIIVKRIEVQGHTDHRAPQDYNQALSQRRVDAVIDFLVSKGVPRSMLVGVGHGENCPVTKSRTKAGMQKNRRVNLFIVDPLPAGTSKAAKWPQAAPIDGCYPKATP